MNKTQLINLLLRRRNGKRYLEIGFTEKDENCNDIQCRYKINVANRQGATFVGSSDDYFREHSEQFDLIFIDGEHTEEQVLKDIEGAFHCLAPEGIIVLHDCMPPTGWHQREPGAFMPGQEWNGTVWKAVLRTFNQCGYRCYLVDTDWGCGIIDTAGKQQPVYRNLPLRLDYALHYQWLLDYKISVPAYLRSQVKVFYHLACMGNWEDVFKEQMLLVKQNGFQWLDITALGSEDDISFVNHYLQQLGIKASVIFQRPEFTLFETPAFFAIQEYAQKNDGYILYLHSKGVSNPADSTKVKWRRLMMQELVEKSDYCLSLLPQYDLIGVNWREMPPISHFCGNFWYASTQYIRKLPDFNIYYNSPRYKVTDAINSKRLGCEFWIGAAKEEPKILSLAYRNVDFCDAEFWKTKYA